MSEHYWNDLRTYYETVEEIIKRNNERIKNARKNFYRVKLGEVTHYTIDYANYKIKAARDQNFIKSISELSQRGLIREFNGGCLVEGGSIELLNFEEEYVFGEHFVNETLNLFQQCEAYSHSVELQTKLEHNEGRFSVVGDVHGNFFAAVRPLLESGAATVGYPAVIFVNNKTLEVYNSFDEALANSTSIYDITASLNLQPREEFNQKLVYMGDFLHEGAYSEETFVSFAIFNKRVQELNLEPEHPLKAKLVRIVGNHEMLEVAKLLKFSDPDSNPREHDSKFSAAMLVLKGIADGSLVIYHYDQEKNVIFAHGSLDTQNLLDFMKSVSRFDEDFCTKFGITAEQKQAAIYFRDRIWGTGGSNGEGIETPELKHSLINLVNSIFQNVSQKVIECDPNNIELVDLQKVMIMYNLAERPRYIVGDDKNIQMRDADQARTQLDRDNNLEGRNPIGAENLQLGNDTTLGLGHTKSSKPPQICIDLGVKMLPLDLEIQHMRSSANESAGQSVVTRLIFDNRAAEGSPPDSPLLEIVVDIEVDAMRQGEFLHCQFTPLDQQLLPRSAQRRELAPGSPHPLRETARPASIEIATASERSLQLALAAQLTLAAQPTTAEETNLTKQLDRVMQVIQKVRTFLTNPTEEIPPEARPLAEQLAQAAQAIQEAKLTLESEPTPEKETALAEQLALAVQVIQSAETALPYPAEGLSLEKETLAEQLALAVQVIQSAETAIAEKPTLATQLTRAAQLIQAAELILVAEPTLTAESTLSARLMLATESLAAEPTLREQLNRAAELAREVEQILASEPNLAALNLASQLNRVAELARSAEPTLAAEPNLSAQLTRAIELARVAELARLAEPMPEPSPPPQATLPNLPASSQPSPPIVHDPPEPISPSSDVDVSEPLTLSAELLIPKSEPLPGLDYENWKLYEDRADIAKGILFTCLAMTALTGVSVGILAGKAIEGITGELLKTLTAFTGTLTAVFGLIAIVALIVKITANIQAQKHRPQLLQEYR
ncbi:MAG: hypothetical protein LBJ93_03055 [Clostridiales bacterium]|jgi:hypothetical protein|nr:hypothetical protein [Clostridiales bacterium]